MSCMQNLKSKFQEFINGLDRPLIIFDTETTGTDPQKDRICQLAFKKITPDGEITIGSRLINPTIEIPQGATDVHGITNDMVKDEPKFKQVAKSLFNMFKGCYVCGFNSNTFDTPLIVTEFERCGIFPKMSDFKMLDVRNLYLHVYPNKLSDIYERLIGKEMKNAHEALADVEATYEVLEHLINNHADLQVDNEELENISHFNTKPIDFFSNFVQTNEGDIIINFGKNKGSLALNEPSYLQWMNRSDFSHSTKEVLKKLLEI